MDQQEPWANLEAIPLLVPSATRSLVAGVFGRRRAVNRRADRANGFEPESASWISSRSVMFVSPPCVRASHDATALAAVKKFVSSACDGELALLAEQGYSLRRIARDVGLSHETVRKRLRR
jgi:hypothetical protein